MGYIIGLDIGSHAIKASVFEGSLGRYTFQKNMTVLISNDSSSLIIRQNEALEKLRSQFSKETRWFLAYPAEGLSIKKLTLPFDDQAKVEQTLPFYIEDQIPFDIDDVVLSSRVINIQAGKTDLFLSVAPKEKLQNFFTRFSQFDIDTEILPVDADLLSNASNTSFEVIIDIGHHRTLFTLTEEGKTIQIRSIGKGMGALTDMLSQRFPGEDIHALLTNTNIAPSHVLVEEEEEPSPESYIIQEVHKWSNAVRQVLISFEDSQGIEVSQISLCGGGSQLPGIAEYLSDDFGVPTFLMQLPNQDIAGVYGLSYWIAQCAIGNTHGRELNLRTGEFSYRGNLERIGTLIKGFVVASIILLCLGFSWFGYQYVQLKAELSQKNTDLFTLFAEIMPNYPIPDDPSLVASLISTEIEDTEEQVNTLKKIFPTEPPILSKLKAFSEHLPAHTTARIDVSEMKLSKNSINVKAETDQFEQATSIVQELKTHPPFAQAQKSDEKNIANAGVRFNIVIPLVQETKVGE